MAKGDEEAYRAFYDAYFQRLWRYLLVVTGGDEEASREALQATLVRVVRHIKPFPNEGAFWSWLTVLARSALSDQTRKCRRYLAFLDRFRLHAPIQEAAPDEGDADARLFALLDQGLAALPEDECELVRQKYIEGRSVREIAGERQTSEKAIESRLVRIRRKLKETVLHELREE
ncbi:MAG TPA: RNA polymerase sigma factor [Candidatus Acidoferrum sp.]|nr:RNA polymerase sigma factor [Candidatus Acidoferrum sp.]